MKAEQTGSSGVERVALPAMDGYALTMFRYHSVGHSKGNILVAGATGVRQRFYSRFADYARQRGFNVHTLDYRGIGESKPDTLKGFEMRYLDWAQLDLAAAVDAVVVDSLPLFVVGHSFGGHAIGLLPNHNRISKVYTFATGAGWHGWMPYREQIKVLLMWNVLGPVLTGIMGYLPGKAIGLGEDLPLGVYQDWRRWCQFPHYFFDDPKMAELSHRFSLVNVPFVAANALDDLWATPRSRDAFMAAYVGTDVKLLNIDPAVSGAIGHMGYFKKGAEPLWSDVLNWFELADIP
jgi:predicted alpha/beta hydrolase